MKVYFHPEAEKEFQTAIRYYEECQPGLGLDFAEEVYAAIARIIEYPCAWAAFSSNTRRCLANRYPYGIIYRVKSDSLHIIAVANLNRRPKYWKKRKS
jgi:hypothetical protein